MGEPSEARVADLDELRTRVDALCQMTSAPGWRDIATWMADERRRIRDGFPEADTKEKHMMMGYRNCLVDLWSLVWSPFIALKDL